MLPPHFRVLGSLPTIPCPFSVNSPGAFPNLVNAYHLVAVLINSQSRSRTSSLHCLTLLMRFKQQALLNCGLRVRMNPIMASGTQSQKIFNLMLAALRTPQNVVNCLSVPGTNHCATLTTPLATLSHQQTSLHQSLINLKPFLYRLPLDRFLRPFQRSAFQRLPRLH